MGSLGILDILLIIFFIVVLLGVGLYFLNKWASKKMADQEDIIKRTRTVTSIYVIDKKKEKATNVNLPKAAISQMPKIYKLMKMPFVKAKIGPQILTLMCDKKVYDAIPLKKNVKVGLAGIYIVDMVGMKTEKEIKEARKAKKLAKKGENKSFLQNIKSKFTEKK